MISASQTLEGVTSKVGEDKHIILWDLENCSLEQAKQALAKVQAKYRLGDIWITSDAEGSYRGCCFSIRPWKEYLKILLDTPFLDYNFFFWTVKRGSATLRTSNKLNREPQKVVAWLRGYEPTARAQVDSLYRRTYYCRQRYLYNEAVWKALTLDRFRARGKRRAQIEKRIKEVEERMRFWKDEWESAYQRLKRARARFSLKIVEERKIRD